MSAQVVFGGSTFTVRGAVRLHLDGEVVRIQPSSSTGGGTVSVAGRDLLVTIEPPERFAAVVRRPERAAPCEPHWEPVEAPVD